MKCKGCGRDELTREDFPKDSSKPSGLHSRCRLCKRDQRSAESRRARRAQIRAEGAKDEVVQMPPMTISESEMVGRVAVEELIRRHEFEFRDLLRYVRMERRTNQAHLKKVG